VNLLSTDNRFRIVFPGGEIIYRPSEGIITDMLRKRSISLPGKRNFSLFSAARDKKEFRANDYKPVCLTIYTSHICNLNCSYCYIPGKGKYSQEFIDPAVVKAGAELIANNCKEKDLPFIAGFHGGNEPLLYPSLVGNYLNICKSEATRNNLDFLSFCTTNGVIPESTAIWAAENFHGITISWDGPPEIHDAYRKDRSDEPTCKRVEKSAGIFSRLKKTHGIFRIRCTVTRQSVEKLEEITRYFSKAGVKNVEFYPVFQNNDHILPPEIFTDPVKFVYFFLRARSYGMKNGMDISFSGARLNEYHNRFCMILQDNLTVTPDGYITNCYYHTHKWGQEDDLFFYGKYNSIKKTLEFDHEIIDKLIDKYSKDPVVCSECFNQFHCSHGCPDICPFNDQYNITLKPDCLREKWLGLAWILENAGYLKDFYNEAEFADYFHHITFERI